MTDYEYTATYSAEDNKIRIYPTSIYLRMDDDLYSECRANGFKWAPIQKLFVAPRWTPQAEDFALKIAGEIEREETTLIERAQAKAERLDRLAEKREDEAVGFFKVAQRLSERFNGGQPILIGHHSEKSARRDQKKMDSALRNSVTAARKVNYWNYRASGVERHANQKNSDRTRISRISRLLAELRTFQRSLNEANSLLSEFIELKNTPTSEKRNSNIEHLAGYKGFYTGAWRDLKDGNITHEKALDDAIEIQERIIKSDHLNRSIIHTLNRLGFERDMLGVVSKFDGNLTAVIIQYFARTFGVEKPKAEKTENGFLLSSKVPLPFHIGEGYEIELTDSEWIDFMCDLGHTVPEEKAKTAPILNFKFDNLEIKRPYGNTGIVEQVEMTKAEYMEIYYIAIIDEWFILLAVNSE